MNYKVSLADLEETVKRAVVLPAKATAKRTAITTLPAKSAVPPANTVPPLQFPVHYIVAPAVKPRRDTVSRDIINLIDEAFLELLGENAITKPLTGTGQCMAVYQLEMAPAWAFDAWCSALAEGGIIFDFAMAAKLLHIDRSCWNIQEKWKMLNALAEAGIALPLYSREEALAALKTMEVRSV